MLADTTSTAISLTIGLGALIAFVAEIVGVARNAKQGDKHDMETITDYVRWAVAHSKVARVAVGVFCISLFWHFLYGGPLLP